MFRPVAVALSVTLLLLIGGAACGTGETVFRIYLSATGSDAEDGLRPKEAVRTLARVQEVLRAHSPHTDVEIRIKRGVYVAPQTTWDFYIPGRSISFLPADYQYGEAASGIVGRPIFRGDGSRGWWLRAQLPAGHRGGDTGLRFYYLQVERYSSGGLIIHGGITTNRLGLRVPATAGANRNTIYGMLFQQLGSKHADAGFGFGGVDLVNSSRNVIRNNHFRYHENIGADASLIHGVYLAHGSKRNRVTANRFDFISGSLVRTRNDSNGNHIYANTFEGAGPVSHYAEWFCDAPCVRSNPGHPRECASHNNHFHHNTILGFRGVEVSLWTLQPPGPDYAGGRGCDNEGEKRLRTYANSVIVRGPASAPLGLRRWASRTKPDRLGT